MGGSGTVLWALLPGFVQYILEHSCAIAVKLFYTHCQRPCGVSIY